MPVRFCLSCGGRYHTESPEGIRYFHACPPHTIVSVTRGALALDVELHQVQPGDIEVDRTQVPRANARNENVILTGPNQGDPIAAGAGVLEADNAASLEALVAVTPAAATAATQGAPAPTPTPAKPVGVVFA